MKHVSLLALACILVFGCGPEKRIGSTGPKTEVASSDASKAEDLLPLTEGNAWTYYVEQTTQLANAPRENRTYDRVLKVNKVFVEGNAKIAELLVLDEKGEPRGALKLRVDPTGVYQLDVGAGEAKQNFSTPFPWFLWGKKEGEKSTWEGTGPLPGYTQTAKMSANLTYIGPAEVDGMDKRYKSFRYDSVQRFATTEGKSLEAAQRTWFSPKVGIVRLQEALTDGTNVSGATWRIRSATVK
jgi:hypothetical protein